MFQHVNINAKHESLRHGKPVPALCIDFSVYHHESINEYFLFVYFYNKKWIPEMILHKGQNGNQPLCPFCKNPESAENYNTPCSFLNRDCEKYFKELISHNDIRLEWLSL
jgi:hypothetical protein